jgi:hypothetical protein
MGSLLEQDDGCDGMNGPDNTVAAAPAIEDFAAELTLS